MESAHRQFSVQCFNDCWTLIDAAERTAEDVQEMVLLASASLWHWKQRPDCTPTNLSIGLWQVARVLALAGSPDLAAAFGEHCLRVGQQAGLTPFYTGYAREALCRAAVVQGRWAAAAAHLAQAQAELARVQEADERELLARDLDSLAQSIQAGPHERPA